VEEDPFLLERIGAVVLPGRTMGGISESEAVVKKSAIKRGIIENGSLH
jgi:hypothetical protein